MTTALPEASPNQTPDEHMQISRRFIQHAREELDKGERLQASQKIYGAAQHALAAVGKERGWRTEDYRHKDAIAGHLAEEFNNPLIRIRNNSYDRYHVNFYQNRWDEELNLRNDIDDVEQFVNDLADVRARGPQPFRIEDRLQITRLTGIAGNQVVSGLQVGQTYTDGFVNQRTLARYRSQWGLPPDYGPPEGGENSPGPSSGPGPGGRPAGPSTPPDSSGGSREPIGEDVVVPVAEEVVAATGASRERSRTGRTPSHLRTKSGHSPRTRRPRLGAPKEITRFAKKAGRR